MSSTIPQAAPRPKVEVVRAFRAPAVETIERIYGEVEAQSSVLRELLEEMHHVQEIAAASRARTTQTASAARDQGSAMEEISATTVQLATMAAEMNEVAGRFRVN